LQDLSYPTLDSYAVGLTPQIYKTTLCNDDPTTEQSQSATFTKEIGTKHIWSVTASFSISDSLEVSGGVPEVATVKDTFTWTVGVSTTYSQEEDTTTSQTENYPVNVPNRTRVTGTFTWWNSECDVPYTANLYYTFSDSSSHSFAVSDTFKGAYITDVNGDFHSEGLATGESC